MECFEDTAAEAQCHQLVPLAVQNLKAAENRGVQIPKLVVSQVELSDMGRKSTPSTTSFLIRFSLERKRTQTEMVTRGNAVNTSLPCM